MKRQISFRQLIGLPGVDRSDPFLIRPFSWTLVFGVLFFRHSKGWRKLWGPVYPVLTLFVIVITGNHFFLDAIAGGLLAVAALLIVELTSRRRRRAHYRHYRKHPN